MSGWDRSGTTELIGVDERLSGDTLHEVVFQIARVITESTVKVHMKAILRKLRTGTQAAIWARTHLGELRGNAA
jgi:hypothetical protein